MPKPIFVAMPGVFGKQEQARIRASGYCFVEVDAMSTLDAFKILDTFGPVDSQHIFKSAMWAIANANTGNYGGPKTLFGQKLSEELSK